MLAMRARYLMDSGASAIEVGEAAEAAVRHPAVVEAKGPDSLWALNCAVALFGAERFDVLEAFLTWALSVVRARGSDSRLRAHQHSPRAARQPARGPPKGGGRDARRAESGGLSGFYRYGTSSVLMLSLIEQGR